MMVGEMEDKGPWGPLPGRMKFVGDGMYPKALEELQPASDGVL
jgi:hypothetical protein